MSTPVRQPLTDLTSGPLAVPVSGQLQPDVRFRQPRLLPARRLGLRARLQAARGDRQVLRRRGRHRDGRATAAPRLREGPRVRLPGRLSGRRVHWPLRLDSAHGRW